MCLATLKLVVYGFVIVGPIGKVFQLTLFLPRSRKDFGENKYTAQNKTEWFGLMNREGKNDNPKSEIL